MSARQSLNLPLMYLFRAGEARRGGPRDRRTHYHGHGEGLRPSRRQRGPRARAQEAAEKLKNTTLARARLFCFSSYPNSRGPCPLVPPCSLEKAGSWETQRPLVSLCFPFLGTSFKVSASPYPRVCFKNKNEQQTYSLRYGQRRATATAAVLPFFFLLCDIFL